MLNAWMKGCDSFLGIQDTLKALADPIRREILISIPPPSAGGTNSNESVLTLYVVL